jgi:putative lipoprotein
MLTVDRRALAVCLALATWLTGCAASPDRGEPAMLPVETGRTFVYECADYEFVARTGPGEIALYLPYDYLVLGQVRSASGAKYSGDGVTFWSKGQEASIDLGSGRISGCINNPARVPWEEARRRGVEFRAVGNEPGWYLEIRQQQLLFVGKYGDERVLAATPQPEVEGDSTFFRTSAASRSLVVEILDESCSDTMSGELFETAVTVTLADHPFLGCGRFLSTEWQ